MKRKHYIVLGGALVFCLLLSVFNASRNSQDLKIKNKIIHSSKVDEDISGTTIAYFSDLYLGENSSIDRVKVLVESIDTFDPDILLFSGDLFEDNSISSSQEEELISLFSSIYPKYGKYAVFGDYDLRNENTRQLSMRILENSGFKIITNSSESIFVDHDSSFNLVGIDSAVLGSPDYESAFNNVDSNKFTLVLTHCPDTFKMISEYTFDYCLSGHSLGGKVYIPFFSFLVSEPGYKNYIHGTIKDKDKTLYITNGFGTPGSNYRLNSDPEVVFFTLKGE